MYELAAHAATYVGLGFFGLAIILAVSGAAILVKGFWEIFR